MIEARRPLIPWREKLGRPGLREHCVEAGANIVEVGDADTIVARRLIGEQIALPALEAEEVGRLVVRCFIRAKSKGVLR